MSGKPASYQFAAGRAKVSFCSFKPSVLPGLTALQSWSAGPPGPRKIAPAVSREQPLRGDIFRHQNDVRLDA